ncbi:Putative uncharacterized protein [Propionibacterium freudenreichii]|uniref:hypothetical protein n=1 Tax=Propionibacterium freudenreichii TaxID=1744 RepID=UPI000541FB02|nr:hypothetical protein [Propionibacterium freudenreichii]MDK9322388.1 hypothetical protein [Propionibacterium freudenreichii]CEG87485.1 Putative uncharacterized protein [Propionibacterium freudenreichii]
MGFEVFDKRNAPLKKAPSLTIQRRGIIAMNSAAHAMLGNAEIVDLLFDKERRVMAIRPTKMSPHAYALRLNKRSGQALLSAAAFVKFYNIDTTVSRRYEPFKEADMLCVGVDGESVAVHGNHTKKTSSPPGDEKA